MSEHAVRIETVVDKRKKYCSLTVSGDHLWRTVLTNPEDVERNMQAIMREKCFACGIVDDVPNYT